MYTQTQECLVAVMVEEVLAGFKMSSVTQCIDVSHTTPSDRNQFRIAMAQHGYFEIETSFVSRMEAHMTISLASGEVMLEDLSNVIYVDFREGR